MKSLQVLIAEDEPLIRAGIRDALRKIDGIELVVECGSCAEAVSALTARKVDLALLDVQMPDGSGLEIIESIGARDMPAVVFVTAYDEYAVKAFELNAVDYLLKPFDDARLYRSIERARDRIRTQISTQMADQLQALLDARARRWPERIVVRNGDRFDLVPTNSIEWIESADNYVQLHCGPKLFLLAETLSGLEARLNPQKFIRIHRRRIVNLAHVAAIHPILGGAFELELKNGQRLGSGRQYRDRIQAILSH